MATKVIQGEQQERTHWLHGTYQAHRALMDIAIRSAHSVYLDLYDKYTVKLPIRSARELLRLAGENASVLVSIHTINGEQRRTATIYVDKD